MPAFSPADLTAFAKMLGASTREALKPLKARLDALEARLEARSYRGTWDKDTAYRAENLVTAKGSMWIATRDTRPGEAPPGPAWTLCVRAGRDAR
jgi:hypothetical protein